VCSRLVILMYQEWDYNKNGYASKTRFWYFDESGPKLTATS